MTAPPNPRYTEGMDRCMKIKLSKELSTTVDAEDYKRCVVGPQWYALASRRRDGSVRTHYAVRNIIRPDGSRTTQFMHRFILQLTNSKVQTDHEDGNGLNNRRNNLKKATNLQNGHKERLYPSNTSGVTGVYRDKKNSKWVAEIITYGQYIFLGRFSSLLDAKKARQKAERERERDQRVQVQTDSTTQ